MIVIMIIIFINIILNYFLRLYIVVGNVHDFVGENIHRILPLLL